MLNNYNGIILLRMVISKNVKAKTKTLWTKILKRCKLMGAVVMPNYNAIHLTYYYSIYFDSSDGGAHHCKYHNNSR